jgi:hypothetical protein
LVHRGIVVVADPGDDDDPIGISGGPVVSLIVGRTNGIIIDTWTSPTSTSMSGQTTNGALSWKILTK